MSTKLYQYGSDPVNQIELLPQEADAVNELRILHFDETTGYALVNLTDEELVFYDSATTKLNKYLETHSVPYTDEDLQNGIPVLRLVK